ncbi:MAG: hypothetical protein SNJ63_10595, partial [Sphingomonadaceae bacterium]
MIADRRRLRRDARAARAAFVATLPPALRRAMEEALARHVLPLLAGASCVGAYAAAGSEIDPIGIAGGGLRPLAFPRTVPAAPLS